MLGSVVGGPAEDISPPSIPRSGLRTNWAGPFGAPALYNASIVGRVALGQQPSRSAAFALPRPYALCTTVPRTGASLIPKSRTIEAITRSGKAPLSSRPTGTYSPYLVEKLFGK